MPSQKEEGSLGSKRINFFGSEPFDYTPVEDFKSFEGLGETIDHLQDGNRRTIPCVNKVVHEKFLPMYIRILEQQTQKQYVSVTWARTLHSVLKRVCRVERDHENTSRYFMWIRSWSLEKLAGEFKHEFQVLNIALTFHCANKDEPAVGSALQASEEREVALAA